MFTPEVKAERCFEVWPKKKLPMQDKLIREILLELRMAERNASGSGFRGRKNWRILNVCQWLHRLWQRLIYHKRCTVVCVPTSYGINTFRYGTDVVSYGSCGKKGLPGLCNVLPPASDVGVLCCTATGTVLTILVYCIIHCTTRTTFSELPQAPCWSANVFSVIRAVINLLLNILWCHSLLVLDIVFPVAISMTKLAFLFWMLSLVSCRHFCRCRQAHMIRKKGDYVCNLCFLC